MRQYIILRVSMVQGFQVQFRGHTFYTMKLSRIFKILQPKDKQMERLLPHPYPATAASEPHGSCDLRV